MGSGQRAVKVAQVGFNETQIAGIPEISADFLWDSLGFTGLSGSSTSFDSVAIPLGDLQASGSRTTGSSGASGDIPAAATTGFPWLDITLSSMFEILCTKKKLLNITKF